MLHRFQYTTGGASHDYLTDRVAVAPEVDGEVHDLLSRTSELEVRGIRLTVEVEAAWDQDAGTAKSAGRLWLDMLSGSGVRFYPDTSDLDTYLDLVPDLSHKPTLYAATLGTLVRGQALRFQSVILFNTGDAMLQRFADLIPAQ